MVSKPILVFSLKSRPSWKIAIEKLFFDCSGTCYKECNSSVKPSSLGKTFLGILDPEIPFFVDSAQHPLRCVPPIPGYWYQYRFHAEDPCWYRYQYPKFIPIPDNNTLKSYRYLYKIHRLRFKKIFAKKNFGPKKIFGPKKMFGPNKFFGPKKCLVRKKNLV